MATGDGPRPDDLTHLARLAQNPESYHIFHAFRIIEAQYKDAPRFGESRRPRDDKVRLGQEAELKFPPSTILNFEAPTGKRPGKLTNRFFGLFGPQGPLPLHLTEYARDRLRNHRDPTFVAFANMLTHRLMGLFYRAWSSAEPAPSFDRPENDPVERKVAAIAGFHAKALRQRDAMPDLAKRHFAGHMALGPKNPEGLVSMLGAFFRSPVQVIQFVGTWLELEPGDRWHLGATTGLGQATSVGGKVWSRSAKFRLRVGPLGLEDYKRLLPGSGSLERLEAVVRNYVGDALDWDVNLVLRADEVPASTLGEDYAARTHQLGWREKERGDADDLFLLPTRTELRAAPG